MADTAGTAALWLSTALLGDISLPPTHGVDDQKSDPYCTLFAMSTFLEAWRNSSHEAGTFAPSVALEPGFLAIAYNRLFSTGHDGTRASYLLWAIQRWGIIPGDTAPYWEKSWRAKHRELISVERADEILDGKYLSPSVKGLLTGRTYLRDIVRFNLKDFELVDSNYSENHAKSPDEKSEVIYRYGSDSVAIVNKLVAADGVKQAKRDPLKIYEQMKRQLYAHRPVFLEVNTSMVNGYFSRQHVIWKGDLVGIGESKSSNHAITAVGHCDRGGKDEGMCRFFGPELRTKEVDECIVIQNSWGQGSHSKGFACISPGAMKRMLTRALILSKYAH